MNFYACVDKHWPTASSDYFIYIKNNISNFHHFLSVPEGSFARDPMMGGWGESEEMGLENPYFHSHRFGKVPRGAFLNHSLTFSLKKMECNSWVETNFSPQNKFALRRCYNPFMNSQVWLGLSIGWPSILGLKCW